MALKALLASLEGLDDVQKALYRPITDAEHSGKFVLDVSGFSLMLRTSSAPQA